MNSIFPKRIARLLATGLLPTLLLAACGAPGEPATTSVSEQAPASASAASASTPAAPDTTDSAGAGASTAATPADSTAASTAAQMLAAKAEPHAAEVEGWDSAAAVQITLNGTSIAVDGDGVTVDGSTATITAPGTYSLSGSLSDGQIVVDSAGDGTVRLLLDGAELNSSSSAPLYIQDAQDAVLVLLDGTENYVSDATEYVYQTAEQDEPNAAIYSSADLTIGGAGALTVEGNFNDAIASQDGLVIAGGTITANAVDDGIRGKDYLVVENGTLAVEAQGDALKADNAEDPTLGYISIESGDLTLVAGGDAIAAETDVTIAGGELALTSGGGSGAQVAADSSAKGIKASAAIAIDGGTLAIDSADDAINSNGSVAINGGSLRLASADDAVHADATLTVNGGTIDITAAYEGLESAVITINDGRIHVASSDDAVNVAGGVDGSGQNRGFGGGPRGQQGGRDASAYTGEFWLYINGGTLVVDSAGDGLDANGAIKMSGGTVLVHGPTAPRNGALDYDGGFAITGGLLVAAGSSGMSQAPDASSSQASLLVNYTATQPAGTLVSIQNSAGDVVLTFAPNKDYQSIAVSSPKLANGESYTVYAGGSASGSASDGLYADGAYTPGTQYTSFTVEGVVTTIGQSSRFR